MATFDNVSNDYKNKSLVQQKAALKLFELLKIGGTEDILDVACGPGHITKWLKDSTKGRVVGIDISEGMINRAHSSYPGIEFRQAAVQDLDYKNNFDVVFCNSSLQWFTEPDKSVRAMFNCLKPGGRLGASCPGTFNWAPWFIKIVQAVSRRKEIEDIFNRWKNPWWWLETEDDYKIFFEHNGFKTTHLEIAGEEDYYPVEKAYSIYLSGAANGFLGKAFYDIDISDDYINTFNNFVKEEMVKNAENGQVKVDFNRLYYVGLK